MTYELFDLHSGNWVGSYDTKDEAFDVVRSSWERHGFSALDGLALIGTDGERQELLAQESELGHLAIGTVLIEWRVGESLSVGTNVQIDWR
jgi:hypothetical protein